MYQHWWIRVKKKKNLGNPLSVLRILHGQIAEPQTGVHQLMSCKPNTLVLHHKSQVLLKISRKKTLAALWISGFPRELVGQVWPVTHFLFVDVSAGLCMNDRNNRGHFICLRLIFVHTVYQTHILMWKSTHSLTDTHTLLQPAIQEMSLPRAAKRQERILGMPRLLFAPVMFAMGSGSLCCCWWRPLNWEQIFLFTLQGLE